MSFILRILFNKPFTIDYVYLKKEVATSPVKHDCFCCSLYAHMFHMCIILYVLVNTVCHCVICIVLLKGR